MIHSLFMVTQHDIDIESFSKDEKQLIAKMVPLRRSITKG